MESSYAAQMRHLACELDALPDPAPGHLPKRLEFAAHLADQGAIDDWTPDGVLTPLGDLVDFTTPAPEPSAPTKPWSDGTRYHIPVRQEPRPPADEAPRWDDEGGQYA